MGDRFSGLLAIFGFCPAVPLLSTKSIIVWVDEARLDANGVLTLSGSVSGRVSVESFEIRVAGLKLSESEYEKPRLDVSSDRPAPSNLHRFAFAVALGENARQAQDVLLIVHAAGGVSAFARRTIVRGAQRSTEIADIQFFIDSPQIANGSVVQPVRRVLAIYGWAVARYGVAAIEVFLDGEPVGIASRGIRRPDVNAAHTDWPDTLKSGFAVLLPRKVFSKDEHVLRVAVRDKRGEIRDLELKVQVEPTDIDDERVQLRPTLTQAEIDLKTTLILASPVRPVFAVLIMPSETEGQDDLARTFDSLRAQAFANFRVGIVTPLSDTGKEAESLACATGMPLGIFTNPAVDLTTAGEALLGSETGSKQFFLCLRAGDRLGADALLEFALEIVTHPEEDFLYADDRRQDFTREKLAVFLKPEWSPDLLLSMNYIGRAWCASVDLVRRAGLTVALLRDGGDYNLTLRLTEAADEIGRVPLILLETGPTNDVQARETDALSGAILRRDIDGSIETTWTPGVYHLKRRLQTKALVSIVIPTIASGGLIAKCIASIRELTSYSRFEIVCVDNIEDSSSSWKDWLKRNADCVVEYPAPFNWSKLNNLGAEAALGEYFLFLNDDIEVVNAHWLSALMEHAERAEVGIVGPRLLYPDGRIQHAGMFLVEHHARHAFRFAEEDETGAFGIGAAQRNVASVTGACMLIRRTAFNEVGGFDERHRVVNNDVDICLRMWRAGLRVVYTPHATLIHHELASRMELADEFDEIGFGAAWSNTFALGDPFFHPHLSRDADDYAPEPEPTRVIVAGPPLIARDKVRRILVQKLDHVGDFITGLPAIRRLKERFPSAEIHVLAPTASVALASLAPAIDNVIQFDFFHATSQEGQLEIEQADWDNLKQRLNDYRFDIAIDLRKHTDTREVLKYSGARMLAGFDQDGAFPWLDVAFDWIGDQQYLPKRSQIAQDFVALVEAVSEACECERRFIPASLPEESDAAFAALCASSVLTNLRPGLIDRPIVIVHPGAGNELRQWPPEHFAQLIDLIVMYFDVNVALVGAPNEAAITEAVLAKTRADSRVWSLVGLLELTDMPILLRAARLFIGNNSGPHHVAAALGTPTIGVHSGVVSAREWGPFGPLAVALQRDMSCGPCYLDKADRCLRDIACLRGLRPADVFRVCEQMLGARLRVDNFVVES